MHAHRRHGRVVTLALLRIELYRASGFGASASCRFTPSCSRYAEEALCTRRLPIAVLLIAWRLLRCNPFMHRRVADPVRRTHRWRLRPNTLPTVFSILALSGFVVVVTAGVAEAVGVSGGCKAVVNQKDPATLTQTHPLVVHKGETVSFVGSIPRSVAAGGNVSSIASNTHIDVDIIQGIGGVTSSDHPGHGPFWSGVQNVDKYLKYGVGLYHVTGHASGTGGWSCSGDAYVQLKDGNPLGKPIGAGAAGLAVVGAAGAALSTRRSAAKVASAASTAQDSSSEPPYDVNEEIARENRADSAASMACLLQLIALIGVTYAAKNVAAGSVVAAGVTGRGGSVAYGLTGIRSQASSED